MSVQTAANRFIVPPKVKSDGLYQQLLKGILNYEQLGNKLIHLSETARNFRQFNRLSEYALILSKLPSEKYQIIGQYYLALSLCRYGRGELERAKTILEKVASVAPLKYRAHAMVTLSAVSWDINQPDNTLKYCIEASKIGINLTTIQALRGIAVLKGREGFHRSSLSDLENLYPMMTHTPPHIYFDYLNSLSVELAECDRLEEARNISKVTCSSPLIVVYPEWRETEQELALRGYKSRSLVPIIKTIPRNVLYLPEPSPATNKPIKQRQARLFSLEKWKEKKMVKEPNGDDNKLPEDMSVQDMAMGIVEMITKNKDDEEKLRKLFEAALKIFSEK
jgi:tetratricopeptide (TPR) repeat protein